MEHDVRTGTCHSYCGDHGGWIRWSAIFIGLFTAVGLSFLFNFLTAGIGLSAFTTNKEGLETLAIGGLIWMLIGSFVVMFLAGMATGSFSHTGANRCSVPALHGFAMWSLSLIVIIFLSSHISMLMPGKAYFANKAMASQMGMMDGRNQGGYASDNTNSADQNRDSTDQNTNISKNTEKKANVLGYAALLAFVLFLIGAIASVWGACYGARRCDHDVNTTTTTTTTRV